MTKNKWLLAGAFSVAAPAALAAVVYLNGLGAAVAFLDTDTFALCQVTPGGCGSSNPLVRGTLAQLATYIQGKVTGAGVTGGQSPVGVTAGSPNIPAGKYYAYINGAIVAPLTSVLPTASSIVGGGLLVLSDDQGRVSATNTWTPTRAGADLIDGGTSLPALGCPYGGWVLRSDGVSNFHVVVAQTICSGAGSALASVDLNDAASLAKLNVTDQTLSGGANVTAQSLATGNITVDCGVRPLQFITNGGAFTLTAPVNDGSCVVEVINNASAGAITFSGFSVGSNTGDALDTTNLHRFMLTIIRINGHSTYRVASEQ